MEIRDNKNLCIFTPINPCLSLYKINKLIEKINKEERRCAIDLTYVQDCTIDFIESLKNNINKEISIFNIPSDIFVLFNIMNIDKTVKLFVSEKDFEEDSRQLINRKFKVI
ncbi:hypothetical protein IJ384_01500 [bacterium]|nr:hypothetical protein [bacterium]